MSVLTAIGKIRPKIINAAGKYGPIAWRPLNFVLLGNNPAHRVQRGSISVAVIATLLAAIILAGSGVQIFATGFGNTINTTNASYHVTAVPNKLPPGGKVNLTATVTNFIPRTMISVTFTVTEPNGSIGSKTVYLTTNQHGNGAVSVIYPDHFAPHASTEGLGTYLVEATFAYAYSIHHATTTFKVVRG